MIKTHTNQEIQNFRPKCLGGKGYKARSIAVSATGFVLPCCWLDRPDDFDDIMKDKKISPLFDKKLHIDNNDTIEDIVSADPWQKFMRELTEKPEESSSICFKMCTTSENPHRKQERW
jgi:hypothetical protein|tara:strand:- start:253 stop:606 length:354 start_codon:yes stop_codon:yes gene_type:complete